ncbi:hypothetical protein MNV49_007443 [Pseudohyphozyma bogoriensis]|nr:hypothetical protein MNV49_007443 [Pseudohyphozyma bogoriensis]
MYGDIYKLKADSGGQVLAVKYLRIDPNASDAEKHQQFLKARQESTILQYITQYRETEHLQIVHQIQLTQHPFHLVLDLMSYSLEDVIRSSHFPLLPSMVNNFFRQIMLGLQDLYAIGIAHLDLKPGNILVAGENDDGWLLQLSDFGGSYLKVLGKGSHSFTTNYTSPEALLYMIQGFHQGDGHWTADGYPVTVHPSRDWWSAGCILVEMLGTLHHAAFRVPTIYLADEYGHLIPETQDARTLRVMSSINHAIVNFCFVTTSQEHFQYLPIDLQRLLPWELREKYGIEAFNVAERLLTWACTDRPPPGEVLEMPYLKSLQNKEVRYHSQGKYRPRKRN